MKAFEQATPSILPGHRVLAVIVVCGLFLWSLAAPVYYVHPIDYLRGYGPSATFHPVRGYEYFRLADLPLNRWTIWIALSHWGVPISSLAAALFLLANRAGRALIACGVHAGICIFLGLIRSLPWLLLSSVQSREELADQYQWGISFPLWALGHAVLLGICWKIVFGGPQTTSDG